MTDATPLFRPGFRVTNSSGTPVSGAKIKVYDAGTLTPRTVYSNFGLSSSLGSTIYTDSGGIPVANSGSSTPVMAYTGTGAYKVIFTTSADVAFLTLDNIQGALDTSTFLTTGSTSTLLINVVTTTAATRDVTIDDNSKLINANTTGGSITHTLDTVANLGMGWSAKFRKASAANLYTITVTAPAVIDETLTSVILKDKGDVVELGCDGAAGFYIMSSRIKSREKQVGDIRLCSAGTARTGELICDGASYLRADYPALFAAIGTVWGAADGTHFNVPYFNGVTLRIRDNGAGVDPDAASRTAIKSGGATGDAIGSYQADALKTHTHTFDKGDVAGPVYSTAGATQPPSRTSFTSTASGNPSTGAANETRMKNAYVGAYILAVTY